MEKLTINTAVPSNTSADEYFKSYCKDEMAEAYYDKLLEEAEAEAEKIKADARRLERLEEQLYFADELIRGLLGAVRDNSQAKKIKAICETLLDNSFYEL
jgi:dynactin complex subunit